ncbi:hypothetical protein AGMMS49573_07710 [Endomicrobiia bacterium]|nr:hypothetical protein AGMMS49573_07710 [Endomicrobiia bacterium]GHT22262.1 hypothetical protein AGMMS49953_00790 [Endomicrobiia bacterium]
MQDIKKDDKSFSYRDEEFVVLNLNFSRGKFFCYMQDVVQGVKYAECEKSGNCKKFN